MTDPTLIRPHVNPDAAFDVRHQASMEAFNTERDLHAGDWGICLGGDASAQIGGQMMTFNWFDSRTGLIQAITAHLVYTFLPPQGYNLDAAQARVQAAVVEFAAHDDPIRLATDLRNALRSHVRVDWIGTLNGLMSGGSDFERGIRAEFFEQPEAEAVAAISADREAEFAEFLSGWMSGS